MMRIHYLPNNPDYTQPIIEDHKNLDSAQLRGTALNWHIVAVDDICWSCHKQTTQCNCINEPSSIDCEPWHEFRGIIRDAKEVYQGYPDELKAIEYIYQRLEQSLR